MPETAAIIGTVVGGAGAEEAAGFVAADAFATEGGLALGSMGAADLAGFTAADAFATGGAENAGAGLASGGFGDAVAGYETLPGTAQGAMQAGGGAPPGGTSPGMFDTMSSLWQKNGGGKGLASLFGKGGQGLGIMQMLSGLYGLQQSGKVGRLATQPNLAGEQAVRRSMLAQGYQGSGNMMAALNQYGINGSQAAVPGAAAGLSGQLASLGLLTAGAPAVASLFGGGS